MSQIKVELQDSMGNDRSVAEAAWTSSSTYQQKNKKTEENVSKVVNMLADSKHSVPFESVVFRFHIVMPIAIDRQFMTHRLQSASGMSGRYRTMPSEFLYMKDDVRSILTKASIPVEDEYNELCTKANSFYTSTLQVLKNEEKQGYITNSEYKRAREFLRGVLPQHNMTERVSVMNLRSFCNFQKLRNKPDAQKEIQEIAELMLKEVENANVCPIALAAIRRNNWSI